MLRALPSLFAIISCFSGAGAVSMEGRATQRPAEAPAEAKQDPQFRPGPYVYQNATRLGSGYSLTNINNPGQVGTYRGGFGAHTAELRLPDADDPALVWYMPEGPIRFYLPSREVSDLSQAGWRYKDCHYQIASIEPRSDDIKQYPDIISIAKARMILVESRCDVFPGQVIRYLFDFRFGLLSFTLGDTATADGERVFVPKETYHLMGNKFGFGQTMKE